MKLHEEVKRCASCLSQSLTLIHDFGYSPLAGYFPKPGEVSEENRIPMQLKKCSNCELVQISPSVDDELLFGDYRYLSRFAMNSHFEELANWLLEKFGSNDLRVLEIGSNDGTLLDKLKCSGMQVVGVDPAENVASYAASRGHQIYYEYFSDDFVRESKIENSFDLIISCNSFAHISEIRKVSRGVSLALKDEGFFVVEVQAWPELVKLGAFDFVYHEHRYYYDLNSISNLLSQFGLFLSYAEIVKSHGNSYRLIFQKNSARKSSSEVLKSEESLTYEQIKIGISYFLNAIATTKQKLIALSSEHKRIVAFGASGRGNMILAQFSTTSEILTVFDESPERIGREMAFTGIPVRDFRELNEFEYDVCLILAWNHAEEIIKKWPQQGKLLIVPFPQMFEKMT
jgi:methylation protein EvaC